jgi:hypothetical protein
VSFSLCLFPVLSYFLPRHALIYCLYHGLFSSVLCNSQLCLFLSYCHFPVLFIFLYCVIFCPLFFCPVLLFCHVSFCIVQFSVLSCPIVYVMFCLFMYYAIFCSVLLSFCLFYFWFSSQLSHFLFCRVVSYPVLSYCF